MPQYRYFGLAVTLLGLCWSPLCGAAEPPSAAVSTPPADLNAIKQALEKPAAQGSPGAGGSAAANVTVPQAPLRQDCIKAGKLMADGVKLGDASKTEENYYREAIALCPEMAESHHNLGVVLTRQGRHQESVAALKKALELKDEPNIRLSLGLAELNSGSLNEARNDLEQVLVKSPGQIKALQALAVVFEREGALDQALEMAKRAEAVDEKNAVTLFNLGAIHQKRGESEAAVQAWKKTLQVEAGHFEAAYQLGLLQLQNGDPGEAEIYLKKAAEINPQKAEVHRALAAVYEAGQDLDKAELALRKALAVNDKDVRLLVDLATVLLEKKQESKALETAKKALALDSRDIPALLIRGYAALELGQADEAESAFNQARGIDESNAMIHNALGVLYRRQGRWSEADSQFEIARKLDPNLQTGKRTGWKFWER